MTSVFLLLSTVDPEEATAWASFLYCATVSVRPPAVLLPHMAASALHPSCFKEAAGDLQEQVREVRFPVND